MTRLAEVSGKCSGPLRHVVFPRRRTLLSVQTDVINVSFRRFIRS